MQISLYNALAVQAALWLLYAVLPLFALYPVLRREAPGVRLALAMFAGVVSQALLATGWNYLIRQPVRYEAMLYLGFWLVFIPVICRYICRRMAPRTHPVPVQSGREGGRLLLILLLGVALRLLHPLSTWALGQSDAYTHLQMFRSVLAQGRLSGFTYPPAYAWLMTMPAGLLRMDPYVFARFGGAFFGGGLVLAVYVLLHKGYRDPRAAWIGAFLLACFPAWNLLIKTGVGAFANQAGLFFLPFLVGGIVLVARPELVVTGGLILVLSLSALLVCVPMMSLHMVAVLLAGLIVAGFFRLSLLPRRWTHGVLGISLAGGVVLIILTLAKPDLLAQMAVVLTTADETQATQVAPHTISVGQSLHMLVRDYVSLKRVGTGLLLYDGVFVLLGLLFGGAVVYGVRARRSEWVLLGCWGAVAAVQTATGMLQFTAYQREGWSLMLAAACLAALVGSRLYAAVAVLRIPMVVVFAVSVLWAFRFPPAHRLTNSSAEDTIVQMVRMFQFYPELTPARDPAVKGFHQFATDHLLAGQQVSFISRPYMQEHMLSAVMGQNHRISLTKRDIWRVYDLWMKQSTQAFVLLDRFAPLTVDQLGGGAAVSPAGAHSFLAQQQRSYQLNEDMEAYILRLPQDQWVIAHYDVTPDLRVYYVSFRADAAKKQEAAP